MVDVVHDLRQARDDLVLDGGRAGLQNLQNLVHQTLSGDASIEPAKLREDLLRQGWVAGRLLARSDVTGFQADESKLLQEPGNS